MTDFILTRVQCDQEFTIGDLTIGGHHVCWTVEDPVRERENVPVSQWKIHGQTAIPYGRYRIRLSYSPRFQVTLPELVDVPGFTGIRIHPGNDAGDTEGCILPGLERRANGVGQSRLAYIEVRKWIDAVLRNGDDPWILINPADALEQVA